MAQQRPGSHEINGYLVDRVRADGATTWEVIHPEQGVVASLPSLGQVRHWTRQHPAEVQR
jgi:hypothetical protein